MRSFASNGPSTNTTFGLRWRRAACRCRATVGEWCRTGNQYSGSPSTASTRAAIAVGSSSASVTAALAEDIRDFTAEGAEGAERRKRLFWEVPHDPFDAVEHTEHVE